MVVVNLKEKDELHYPFCSDLSQKRFFSLEKEKGEGQDKQMNLTWSLFRIKQTYGIFGGGSVKLPNSDVYLPGNYQVERVKGVNYNFFDREKTYQTFIAPSDYSNNGAIFYEDKRKLEFALPEEFKKQPHLFTHSTFQFSFLRNILFSTSLQFLNIDQNNIIQATADIYASPTGTYFVFQSGEIPFKWKIEVRQGVVVMDLMKETIEAMGKLQKKIGSGLIKIVTMGAVDLGDDFKTLGEVIGDMSAKDNWQKMGLDKERISRIQEQQTDRLFKSTYADILDKTIEPSIFYSNSTQFPYNLFDFFLRSFTPHWEVRIHISKTLYNNLIHNNNENPITYPLNVTFKSLAGILRKGYWQGSLKLDYDPGGFMAEKFAKGVTFFEDKEKDFVNPNLNLARVQSSQLKIGHGAEFYQSEEIKEHESWTLPVNRPKGANYWQRGHYFIFYEDGSTEHWMALYPLASSCNFDQTLADGHTHGAFMLEFDKPVKKLVDIYTCIGCGAQNTPLFEALHANYRNNNSDSLETIHKGKPFEPWFTEMSKAVAPTYDLTVSGVAGRLGGKGDVWEKSTQEVADKTFNRAYGFIPNGSTITWRLSGESSRVKLQKVPGHNDFDNLDWTPPIGSGGDIEIPLIEPDLSGIDPSTPDIAPELDLIPELDPTGGEPEIAPLELDITPDIEVGTDIDNVPDISPPEIDVTPPEIDPIDVDKGDRDRGEIDPSDGERPEDFD